MYATLTRNGDLNVKLSKFPEVLVFATFGAFLFPWVRLVPQNCAAEQGDEKAVTEKRAFGLEHRNHVEKLA